MPDTFRRVMAGEPLAISADAWNRLLRLAERGENMTGGPAAGRLRSSGIIRVKNDSGSAKDQFDILGLGNPIITPTANETEFKRQVTFIGTTPTTASHSSKFCILLEPLADDAIGKAVVAGVVQVRLTGADVGWATVTNNDATKLTAGYGGVKVLYAEAGSSERWATVRLGEIGPKTLRGKLDGSLSYQGSATMSVWYYNGSAETDTTNNVTIYDWHLSTGQTVASGKQMTVILDELSGRFYTGPVQCA